jgi:CubicO group peptidase (beta-lactamase class C family)
VIAGYLVEKASGLSWAEFTRTRIFEPLGMRSAHWDRAPAIIDRLARSHQPDGMTPEPYVDIPGKPAGAPTSPPATWPGWRECSSAAEPSTA